MKVIRTILSDKPKAEIETFITNYFRTNGFYSITVKDGLKFSTYSGGKPVLSPKRLSRDIFVKFLPQKNQQKVTVTFDIGGFKDHPLKTDLDKEFYEDFGNHFLDSFEKNEVTTFETESYDKRAKAYTKPFTIIGIIAVLIYILAMYFSNSSQWTDAIYLVYVAVFGVGIYVANWWVAKQKMKKLEA